MTRTPTERPSAALPWPLRALTSPLTLLERTRGRWRFALVLLYLVVAAVLGVLAWRALSLRGLPDIGDPFDPASLGPAVPQDRNAFALYRRASEALRRPGPPDYQADPDAWKVTDWATLDPAIRRWAEDNREALGLWMEGSERPEAQLIDPRAVTFSTLLGPAQDLRDLARLAILDASRRLGEGDVAGAWADYRAVLRASRHAGMRGTAIQRLIGLAIVRQVRPEVESWMADPRVDAPLLRRALAELRQVQAMTARNSEAVGIEYLMLRNELGRPESRESILRDLRSGSGETLYYLPGGAEAYLWLKREPERSLRIVEHVFAGWLAHCDTPPPGRPAMVQAAAGIDLYPPAADGPRGVRSLGPSELGPWLESSVFARMYLPAMTSLQGALDGDRQTLATLELALALALYEREHGGPPKTLGELVGPYLERLPDGYEGLDGPEPGGPGR